MTPDRYPKLFWNVFAGEDYFWCLIVSLNKNIKIILNYLLGPLVFIFLSWAIRRQLLRQADWRGSMKQIGRAMGGPGQWKIWIAVLLMLFNWGLEARKWQLAMHRLQPVSLGRAFKAMLTGTTLASCTPNRMGEYLGRILYVEEGKRMQAISLTMVCSIAQLLITLIAGVGGILYVRYCLQGAVAGPAPGLQVWLKWLLSGTVVVLVGLTVFYFRLSWLVRLLEKKSFGTKYLPYFKFLEDFNSTILSRILFLSFIRYLVFLIQYYLLFSVFGVTVDWLQTAGGMSLVFLLMAVLPSFTFLTELGLRWEAGIQVMGLFSANAVGIFAVSFGIWVVNLIIPALIGSLLILSIKLFRNNK
jgi:hypothetical protein